MVQPLEITHDRQGQGHKAELTCTQGRSCLSQPGLSHPPSLCLTHSHVSLSPCPPLHQFQEEEETGMLSRLKGGGGGRRPVFHLHWIRGHWMQDDLGRPGRRLQHWHHIWRSEMMRQSETRRRVHSHPEPDSWEMLAASDFSPDHRSLELPSPLPSSTAWNLPAQIHQQLTKSPIVTKGAAPTPEPLVISEPSSLLIPFGMMRPPGFTSPSGQLKSL